MILQFLSRAAWLDQHRIRGYLAALALLNGVMLALLVATATDGVDRNGFLLGTDFLSFWSEGRILHQGRAPYDAAAHIAAQHEYFTDPAGYSGFFYPPNFLPLVWLLGFLPYFPALAVWLGSGLVLFALVARGWFRLTGIAVSRLTGLAAFPPVLIGVVHGQSAFFAAGLLGAGTLLVGSSPWLAGTLIGLAAFKPQLGLLIAPMLLASREWKTVLSAGIVVVGVGVLVSWAWGLGIWAEWRAILGPAGKAMEDGAIGFAKMQSLFAGARLIGLPVNAAYAAHGLVAAIVLALGVRAAWGRPFDLQLASLALTGGIAMTPFVLDYDLLLLAFPLIYLASRRPLPWERACVAAVFIAPAFARPVALAVSLPIMPLLLLALFALLVRRTTIERTGERGCLGI